MVQLASHPRTFALEEPDGEESVHSACKTWMAMADYKAELEVGGDGNLTVRGLPFEAGMRVEVVVRALPPAADADRYPLRGLPLRYDAPFDPADAQAWDALR